MTGTAPTADASEAGESTPPAEAEAPPTDQQRAPRRDEASLPARLVPPMPSSGIRGWIGPILVMVFGGILRFADLGRPH